MLSNVFENKQLEKFLLGASPKKCVDFINGSKTHPNLAKLFSGVWEGYTVGEHTEAVLKIYEDVCKEEVKKHVIDIDVDTPAGINVFKPGYISEDDNVIIEAGTNVIVKGVSGVKLIVSEMQYQEKFN